MANVHTTLTSLFDDIADAIRENTPVTEQIKADAFPTYIRMLGYDGTIPATPSVLDSCPWDFIRWASDQGIADLLWSVGDRKQILLNGLIGALNLSNYSLYAFIIGFNHNSNHEGDNRVHFQIGKSYKSEGTDICLVDNYYYTSGSSAAFRINTSLTSSGGWNSSYMRNSICGTSKSSTFGNIIGAIPAELRNAIKSVTKYTNNTGKTSSSSAVTSTTDLFFLLSEYELFGIIEESNRYEANFQEQYSYYKAGNSKIKYRQDDQSTSVAYWLRSPSAKRSNMFCRCISRGESSYHPPNDSLGFSPAFCV